MSHSNKQVSASPASKFISAKDKAYAHRNFLGNNKTSKKYHQKPVHKILNNFMDEEDDEDEEIIMGKLNERKKELLSTKTSIHNKYGTQRHPYDQQRCNWKTYNRERKPVLKHNKKNRKSGEKLSKEEITRIREQAVQAENKYKRKYEAAVRIQRFWRRNKEMLQKNTGNIECITNYNENWVVYCIYIGISQIMP